MKDKLTKFYSKIALEYRLSSSELLQLIEMCEKGPIELSVKQIEEELANKAKNELSYYFLLYHDNKVSHSIDDLRKIKTKIIISITEVRSQDKKRRNDAIKNLFPTDSAFLKLKNSKDFDEKLTKEDMEIISNYRLKHAISRTNMAMELGFSENKLRTNELQLDEKLQKRIKELSDFLEGIYTYRSRSRGR